MWAGVYTLDLYCDNDDGELVPGIPLTDTYGHLYKEFPHQYTAEHGSECRAKARKAGWIIKSDGTAICPKCSGKVKSSNDKVEGRDACGASLSHAGLAGILNHRECRLT